MLLLFGDFCLIWSNFHLATRGTHGHTRKFKISADVAYVLRTVRQCGSTSDNEGTHGQGRAVDLFSPSVKLTPTAPLRIKRNPGDIDQHGEWRERLRWW